MASGLGTPPLTTELLLVAALAVAAAVLLRATLVVATPSQHLTVVRPGRGALLGDRVALMVPFSRAVRAVPGSGSLAEVPVAAVTRDGVRLSLAVAVSWTLLDAHSARLEPEDEVRRAVTNALRWWLQRRPAPAAGDLLVVDGRARDLAAGVAELSGVRIDHLWVRDWTPLPAGEGAAR
nr:hypothetical protein [Propionibacterium sp.]